MGPGARGDADFHAVVFDRVRVVALAIVGIAAIAEGLRAGRIETDRLVEVRDGAIELLLVNPRIAAVVVGERHSGIELDRRIVLLNRAIVVALEAVDAAAVDIRAGVSRIDADRLIEVGERRVELALFGAVIAATAIGGGELPTGYALGVDHGAAGGNALSAGVRRRNAGLPFRRVIGARKLRCRQQDGHAERKDRGETHGIAPTCQMKLQGADLPCWWSTRLRSRS